MNVLHIVPMLFGPDGRVRGGAERYAFELARHVAEKARTTILSFGPEELSERRDELAVRVIAGDWQTRGLGHDPFSLRVFDEIRKADVIHCHQREVRISRFCVTVGRALRKRLVATDHGGGAGHWSARFPTARMYHEHLHVSAFSRRLSGQETWPNSHVIGGGVDAVAFAVERTADARSAAPILFVGRVLPHKGIDDLIEAAPVDYPVHIVGPAVDERYLADLHRLSQGKAIDFFHDWSDGELAQAYANCACLVLPSVYRDRYGSETAAPELLGQTLLEAMVNGRPTVCTDVGGMPEVVVDGQTGLVVPPNDPPRLREALIALLADPARATAMGQRGRQRALDHFSWSAVAARCIEYYRAT